MIKKLFLRLLLTMKSQQTRKKKESKEQHRSVWGGTSIYGKTVREDESNKSSGLLMPSHFSMWVK